MKPNLLACLYILLSSLSFAATYTTTATPGTWDLGAEPGTTPTASDNIVVNHDWSGYNWLASSARSNYAGTLTINSGGYLQVLQPWVNWTGTLTVNSGGTLYMASDASFFGGTINVDGVLEIDGTVDNDVAITGTGTLKWWGTVDNTGGSFAGTLTLPVELISFTAESTGVSTILNWITASEINNDFFEVQKSSNGIDFQAIGTIEGNGNSFEQNTYTFIDQETNPAIVYYRLKQVDFDGSIEYSHVISTKSTNENAQIIQKETSSEFYVLTNQEANYVVETYDISGKLVISESFDGSIGGRFNFEVNQKGTFMVVLKSSDGSIISKKSIIK